MIGSRCQIPDIDQGRSFGDIIEVATFFMPDEAELAMQELTDTVDKFH